MGVQRLVTRPCGMVRVSDTSALLLMMTLFAVSTALVAAFLPIEFSVFIVLLFAGPHNWFEFRYFLSRMPGRWGKLRLYFASALAGVLLLGTCFIAYSLAMRMGWIGGDLGVILLSALLTSLFAWTLLLSHLHQRYRSRPKWWWLPPAACIVMAVCWFAPLHVALAVVYLHPLLALWFLDRELLQSHPKWRSRYHRSLLSLPVLLGALWYFLADAPPLSDGDTDVIASQLVVQSGATLLTNFSSHLLVAAHAFLEMIHYGIWMIMIPLVGLREAPWRTDWVPLARKSLLMRYFIATFLVGSLLLVLLLWGGFAFNYALTRDIYFTVAIIHVLAEIPFLIRML